MKIRTAVLTVTVVIAASNAKQGGANNAETIIEVLKTLVIQQLGNGVVVLENLAQQNIEFNWKGCRVILEGQIIGKGKKAPPSDIQVKVNGTKTIKVNMVTLGQADFKRRLNEIADC